MFRLKTELTFDAAHRLENYEGKCANLHGHSFKIEVEIIAIDATDNGMVVDFGTIKKVINQFDHKYLNEIVQQPTAEFIAKFLYESLKDEINEEYPLLWIDCITVWETPKNCVEYYPHEKGDLHV